MVGSLVSPSLAGFDSMIEPLKELNLNPTQSTSALRPESDDSLYVLNKPVINARAVTHKGSRQISSLEDRIQLTGLLF